MTREDFRTHLAEFLAVNVSALGDDERLEDVGWDSLALLAVVSIADETWGIEVAESELNGCDTVGDLLELFRPRWSN